MTDETNLTPVPETTGRNPFILFIGFALLGVAAAILLFGSSLLGAQDSATTGGETVLEQVGELEASAPVINQIPGNGLGGPAIGEAAPDFVLTDLDGNSHRLSDFQGRPVVVNFWATWCAPCRIEMPELQAAFDRYQEDDLAMLAVNRDESDVVVRDYFYGELGLTFTPLLDQGSVVSDLYEVFNMPTTYFLDASGIVTAVHRGPMTESQLDGYLGVTIAS